MQCKVGLNVTLIKLENNQHSYSIIETFLKKLENV